ncbi:glycoside hydrolase family 3 protein [Kriegella sp. EG-1]|nr:glycoside hydrolase family 3 protein [Flavobacteriaceae bacterium EG-1]
MNKVLKYSIAKDELSTSEKVGQLFMPAAFINDTEEEIKQLEELIVKHSVGGLCFFHSRASAATNYESKKKVVYNKDSLKTLKILINRYQNVSKHPLLIAIDAEWGLAMRIENTAQYPYAITLGALPPENDNLIFEVGKNIAIDCKAAGIHWNLSPVVDINNNPNNPVIGYRSFGENIEDVTRKAIAYVKGSQSENVLTSVKHFPGHGDTATDSHLGLPIIHKTKQELEANELYPFQKLIDEGVDSIMVGHLSIPSLANGENIPSSISKKIIKGVLRDEMNFKGVVISDALNMHAVSKEYPVKGELEWLAFDAGNDVLCFAENTAEGINLILKQASASQIEESFKRVWLLKEKAIPKIVNGIEKASILVEDLNQEIAKKSITLVKGNTNAINNFRIKGFIGVSNLLASNNHFFKTIKNDLKFISLELIDERIFSEENVLLALFPPQVKPSNNFGFTHKEITLINRLVNKKNVVVFLFGNPYLLNILDIKNTKVLVAAYQNSIEFQNVAANQFLGNLDLIGLLPIQTA